jgi:GH3 auxin-responsive promoter
MTALSASGKSSLQGAVSQFMRQYDTARETQQILIKDMLRRNAGTVFGKEHGFRKIRTIEDYQRQVPIRDWAEISPYVDALVEGRRDSLTKEAPFFYQRTTGTTGKPKMVPFTRRCQAASVLTHRMWIYKHLLDCPDLLKGRVMALLNAGIDGYTARGDAYGATSGNIYFRMPPIIRRAYSHPYDVFQIGNVDGRRYTLLRFAVEQNCSFAFTGNPSSLLAIFEFADRHGATLIRDIHDGTLASEFDVPDHLRVFALNVLRPNPRRARVLAKAMERGGKLRPVDYWPDLQALGCWIGGSMGHFSHMLREWCGESFHFRDVGYMASEGVFSIPLNNDNPDGVLALHAAFFEFVPERDFGRANAPVLLAHEIEPGNNYYVIVTTTGGLYRYAINDVIRVSSAQAGSPTIRFLYKGGNVQNLQGELMTVDHVICTMSALTAEFGIKFHHFQVVAELSDRRYVLYIEPTGETPRPVLQQLLSSFERELGKVNENYVQFRVDRLIGAPGLRVMRRGWFDRFLRDNVARTGRDSQFKPSVLASAVEYPEMVETSIELG